MDWENWQSYAAPAIVLITLLLFFRRWKKSRDAKCCGGRCGCSAVKERPGKKKRGMV